MVDNNRLIHKRSRRDVLKQGSLLLVASQLGLLPISKARADQNRAAAKSDSTFVVAETTSGKIRGYKFGPENFGPVNAFKGIPYGASTAGRNRFMPPRKPRPWTDVLDALAPGPHAPQFRAASTDFPASFDWDIQPGSMGEDCLNLNLWTPGVKDGGKRPVLVSLHGGGFGQGSGNASLYAGDALSSFGNVVVVSPNHRLNTFGFLHLADLGAPPEFAQAGVAGMLDLVQVLEWVRDNAENFGGDPNNVMVYGHSGGGMKTGTLLAMPSAKGLFHRAIIQSGSALRLTDRQDGTRQAEKLLSNLEIPKNRIADLQSLSFAQIMEAARASSSGLFNILPGGPVVDGRFIPQHPFDPVAPAISSGVPLIVGTSLDDGAAFLMGSNNSAPYAAQLNNAQLDEAGLKDLASQTLGKNAAPILVAYREAYPRASPFFIYARILTDRGLRNNAIAQAERKAALNGAPVWMYRYDRPAPAYNGRFGAIHGAEVEYTFHSHRHLFSGGTGSADDEQIAVMMASTWLAFARTGNPDNPNIPHWPSYETTRRNTMLFNQESRVASDPDGNLRLLAQKG